MFKHLRLILALSLVIFALPAMAQQPSRYTFFGGALPGSPSGFAAGAGLTFDLNRNLSFDPGFSLGRSGNAGLLTLSGVFRYDFHVDDEAVIPYLLGGVGMAQWGSATHGSAIGGLGARFPIGHHTWIVPEVRLATHGLARISIGFSKSF